MKTDRELLELAARAAGYEYGPSLYEATIDGEWHAYWNPIDDDGDALRLAVKLGFGISIPTACKRTDVCAFSHALVNVIEAHEGDPYAATRRAIVRAAAAIGEGMK